MSSSMKIISINCHGLGIPEAMQELHCLISEEDPKFLFLSETKLDKDGFRRLKRKLDNDSLPTRTKLFERNVLHSFSCVLYNEEAETCDHLYLECIFAQAVWLQTPLLNDYGSFLKMKFIDDLLMQ